jgi:hypothetical protein
VLVVTEGSALFMSLSVTTFETEIWESNNIERSSKNQDPVIDQALLYCSYLKRRCCVL